MYHIEDMVCKLLLSFAPCILRLDEGASGNDVTTVERFGDHAGADVFECDDDRARVHGADPSRLCFLVKVPVTDEDDRQI